MEIAWGPVLAMLVALFALIAIRVPIAFALIASGALGSVLLRGIGVTESALARVPFYTTSQYVLVIIPMFIGMGVFAKNAGLADAAYDLGRRFFGRFPGGLGVSTVFACAAFGAVTGSSVATAATIGPSAITEMSKSGYSKKLAAGIVAASGTLAVLIPPSIVLVIFGIVTGESIGALLIAGIIPGLLSATGYSAYLIISDLRRSRRSVGSGQGPQPMRQTQESTSKSSGTDDVMARPGLISSSLGIAALFLVVVGGIYSGVLAVVEAASIGALISFFIFLGRAMRLRPREAFSRTRRAVLEGLSTTVMVFALLIGGAVFSNVLVVARLPSAVAANVAGLPVPGLLIVALLLLMFIPLGMFLDPLSALLVAVPLAYPIAMELGFDGLWFAILVVKMIELGLITPPIGINVYVISGAARMRVEDVFAGIWMFIPVDLATIALIFAIPMIVTWLPAQMM